MQHNLSTIFSVCRQIETTTPIYPTSVVRDLIRKNMKSNVGKFRPRAYSYDLYYASQFRSLGETGRQLAKDIAQIKKVMEVRSREREEVLTNMMLGGFWLRAWERHVRGYSNTGLTSYFTLGQAAMHELLDANPLLVKVREEYERVEEGGEWEPIPSAVWDRYGLSASYFHAHERTWFHVLHKSVDDPSKVAYYRSISNLIEGKQTRTTLAKYLTEFNLNGSDERRIATCDRIYRGRNLPVLLIDSSPDNWEKWAQVYRKGPNSCMSSGKVDDETFQAYCYKGNGLILAYQQDEDGTILNRAILRDDAGQKGYLRIYPDPNDYPEGSQLKDALAAMGYERRINLDGVRMARHEVDGRFRMPYIDYGNEGTQRCADMGDYLLMGEGPHECDNTSGLASGEIIRCRECGDTYDAEDMTFVESVDGHVCSGCLSDSFTHVIVDGHVSESGITSREYGYVRDRDVVTFIYDGGSYAVAESFMDSEGCTQSDWSDNWFDSDAEVTFVNASGDDYMAARFELEGDSDYTALHNDDTIFVHESQIETVYTLAEAEEYNSGYVRIDGEYNSGYVRIDGESEVYGVSSSDWRDRLNEWADEVAEAAAEAAEAAAEAAEAFLEEVEADTQDLLQHSPEFVLPDVAVMLELIVPPAQVAPVELPCATQEVDYALAV